MSWFEALILGLIQGLTEFLPVSSSGHLELGKHFLQIESEQSLSFTVAVHGATVLSTIVVFWKEIRDLFLGFITFKWNDENKYIVKILVSMIPVGILGLFFEEEVKQFFTGNIIFVGAMLLVTATLLSLTYFSKSREKNISFLNAFIIGIAQALAVLPGISRSGATIVTGIMLGNNKKDIAQFSFLMVLIPVIGANVKDILSGEFSGASDIGAIPIVVGFIVAFVSGLIACKWMINIVKKGKLITFAIYCTIIGFLAIFLG